MRFLFALGLLATSSAGAQCLLHPIEPPCCPSPCPVLDLKRLDDLNRDIAQLTQIVSAHGLADQFLQSLGQSLGQAGMRLLPIDPVELASLQQSALYVSGFAGLPAEAAAAVRRDLLPPAQSSSARAQLNKLRAATAGGEAVASLALGLSRAAKPAGPSALIVAAVQPATDLRASFASSNKARLALLGDMAAFAQTLAARTAMADAAMLPDNDNLAAPALPPAPPASPLAMPPAPAPAPASLDSLRAAAQSLLRSYPALQASGDPAAIQAIGELDQKLGELSDRAGTDLTAAVPK